MANALTLRNRRSITIHAAWVSLGLGLVGCAQDTGTPLGILGFSGNGGAPGAGAPTGGSPGASGTFAMAGSTTSGAGGQPFGSGGQTFGNAGTFSMAGTGGDAGTPAGGGGMGGAPAGGMGGASGSAGNNAAGMGGSPTTAKCGDHAIPSSSQWTASASSECSPTCADPTGPFPTSKAIDGDANTRFSSGKAQAGDEYFQIDLGSVATLNQLSINTVPAGDFTQHYQIKAASSADGLAAAPLLADAAGAAGTININLNQTVNAQVVRIYQTGTTSSWWSINEITIGCQ
jgi:hypothetical protein